MKILKPLTFLSVLFGLMTFNSSATVASTIAPIKNMANNGLERAYNLADFTKSTKPKDYLNQAINGYSEQGSGWVKCNKVLNYDDLSETEKEVRILVSCETGNTSGTALDKRLTIKNFVVVLPKKIGQKYSLLVKK